LNRVPLLFAVLAVVLVAGRMCHVRILWEGDTLPLAAAAEMRHGKALYRDIWYDKPPLVPAFFLLSGARAGWALRFEDALYALLACWLAYRFARDLWSRHEGFWAAGLAGFFLTFDFPSAVIPVASDLMMVAPHLAAVWMAHRRRPFWSGALAGVAFWISPKGALVAIACLFWCPAGIPWIAAGFAVSCGVGVAWLAAGGALVPYWEEVWRWGRLYAGSTFIQAPFRNGLIRTADWAGFHIAAVIAAGRFLMDRGRSLRWIAWLVLSFLGVSAGLRFFPRYYFQILPVVILMASRGFTLMEGRRRELLALLLLIPATRFGPSYISALANPAWRDIGMDRASRAAATFVRERARSGDDLFVWGYRPEIYVYSGLPAATEYLDSQPLTGVPADRHLTRSEPVETGDAARRRSELIRSRPAFILDGLGLYNPRLALTAYPELREWLAQYVEIGRVGQTIIYQRTAAP
jgi:hypothetical protein